MKEYKAKTKGTLLEVTVGHQAWYDQMSGQFHIMIGHDVQIFVQHILSSFFEVQTKSNQITLIESSSKSFSDPIYNNMSTLNTKLLKL